LERQRRTRGDLARRLRDRGYASAVVDQVLDRLAELGLVDDVEYSRAFMAGRPARPRPRGRGAEHGRGAPGGDAPPGAAARAPPQRARSCRNRYGSRIQADARVPRGAQPPAACRTRSQDPMSTTATAKTSTELRSSFLRFFEERGHTIVPSAPLVPN